MPRHDGGGVAKPAMMGGGVHFATYPATSADPWRCQARWHLDPAAMHGGVLFIYPAMHSRGAKRTSFENIFETGIKFKICVKFGLKLKKTRNMHPAVANWPP